MDVSEEQVTELRNWVLSSCDELTIALYLMAQGEHEKAAEIIDQSIGLIEVSMAVFLNGGLDS